MRKKDLLAKLIFSPLNPIGWGLRPYGRGKLFVLAYHRVDEQVADYPFNRTILSATPEQFDRQLNYVKRHFNVIDFHDLAAILAGGDEIRDNTLIITFDDGYKDNFQIAAPILQSHQMKAVFYVTTDNISQGNLLWFDLLHYYVRQMKPGIYSLGSGDYRFARTTDDEQDFVAIGRHLRLIPDEERLAILAQLEQMFGSDALAELRGLADVLNWDEVRQLAEMGFEIGSHSCSHPHLYRLGREDQLRQLRDSKTLIEQQTGRPVVSFSYPTGGFDQITVECVREAGYQFAVAYNEAIWSQGDNRLLIPRIHVEPDIQFERFKGQLVLPRLFLDAAHSTGGQ